MNRFSALLRAATAAAALSLTAPASFAESLADTMVAAYRHSALIDQNRAVLRAADEDVAAAVARLRPVLNWVADYGFTSNLDGFNAHSATIALRAQMTLWDWGRSALAIDIAKETVLATRENLVAVEQDVLFNAVQSFFDVRSALQQVDLQQSSLRVIGQERQAALDRFDVGEITRTDVALAEARLAAVRATLATAQGQLEIARENYRTATGAPPESLDAPPPLPDLPATLDGARAIAQRSHPAILQVQRQAAAAELGVAAAAAERNPTLNGTAGLQADRSRNQLGGGYATTQGAVVGLELSQTIYSGGRLPAAHRQAMAQRDQVRALLLDTSRQISQLVGTSWANIDVALAQISAIEQQISAAQQAYDGVREEAQLGARTTLDVLDAEQSLLEARADRITALANLQLAHYQLLAAMGLLTVENLQLGIPTYDPSEYYNAVRDAPFTSRQGENLDRVLRALGRGGN